MSPNEKLRAFINKNMIIFGEEVSYTEDDNIFKLGFVNSLFAMKLLNYIESEFAITVDDDELNIENFSSIKNMLSLIDKKKV